MMRRLMLPMITLSIAALACALTGGEEKPTPMPLSLTTLTPTSALPSPAATATLPATPTQQTTSNSGQGSVVIPPTVSNCTPRTDWQIYQVKAGDTLGGIAAATGSTVQAISAANCLANPDAIVVGQQLRVPSLPTGSTTGSSGSTTSGGTTTGGSTATTGSTSTGTTGSTGSTTTGGGTTTGGTSGGATTGTTTGGSTTAGSTSPSAPRFSVGLTAKPVIEVSGIGLLSLQATIALDIGVVEDADRVRFYAGLSLSDPDAVNIATDDDPFDGTQVTYTFNSFDNRLYFWAVAENEFGSTRSGAISVTYDPNFNPNAGSANTAVTVNPNLGFDGSIYTVQFGITVTLRWQAAISSASRADFYYTVGGVSVLLGSDTNLADGASITWTVPEWTLGQLSATAFFPDGRTQNSLVVNVYSEGTGVRPSN